MYSGERTLFTHASVTGIFLAEIRSCLLLVCEYVRVLFWVVVVVLLSWCVNFLSFVGLGFCGSNIYCRRCLVASSRGPLPHFSGWRVVIRRFIQTLLDLVVCLVVVAACLSCSCLIYLRCLGLLACFFMCIFAPRDGLFTLKFIDSSMAHGRLYISCLFRSLNSFGFGFCSV